MERSRLRSFLWGSVFGWLLGLLVIPRRGARLSLEPAPANLRDAEGFTTAPCYVPDDRFT